MQEIKEFIKSMTAYSEKERDHKEYDLVSGMNVENAEKSLMDLLVHIGEKYNCDRTYIFEFEDQLMHNTYEWCAPGVHCQKEILRNLQTSEIDWWVQLFDERGEVIIDDIEKIRNLYPTAYVALRPQDIQRLVAVPLRDGKRITGFWGVDNPEPSLFSEISTVLKIFSHFTVLLIKQRDLLRRIDALTIRDDATGAYNRTVLFQYLSELKDVPSVGVVYCDTGWVKRNGSVRELVREDQIVQICYKYIAQEMNGASVYRVNENEFAAVFTGISEFDFMKAVRKFQEDSDKDNMGLVIGYAWSDVQPVDGEALLHLADKDMCNQMYGRYIRRSETREEKQPLTPARDSADCTGIEGAFCEYIKEYYFDQILFLDSLSYQNGTVYFFAGDMQKDVFYISDNLKLDFGFQSNIVPRFLTAWSNRILTEKSREMYLEDHENMIRNRQTSHDLRYRVRDIHGKNVWIHCYGKLKWNEDQTKPLFFSGRITRQDNEFDVDPVTNFPRTSVMLQRIKELEREYGTVRTIGFSLNNITEINNGKGRSYSDQMVKMITQELVNSLAVYMTFYRLDGMRCIAVIEPSCTEKKEILIEKIRRIVSKWYRMMAVSTAQPCSFGYIETAGVDTSPEDFLEQMIFLIKLAKHGGSSSFEEYSDQNVQRIKDMSKMKLAINHDVACGMEHFRVVIQPIVSGKKGSIVGGEILLRWKYEDEDVSPGVFIPMLENTNMIHQAGKWVFEQAVYACTRLHSFDSNFFLTFNMSMQQLSDEHLADDMKKILDKYRLEGDHLIAEMTENFMDVIPEKMMNFAQRCKEMGINIAMDDFGSGYSSLRRLLQYPSLVIKLDRSLLEEMMESEEKKNFIASIVYACHRFGKKVCMEGVENREQDRMIKETECDMLQGFYYYKPMDLDEIYRLLSVS